MPRSVKEWIASSDDTPVPPRVRVRIFERYGGVCQLTMRKIMPGDEWDLEHQLALVNGGEHRESNLVPVLRSAHPAKTKRDMATKRKIARTRKKHLGIKPKSRFAASRDGPWKAKVGGGVERR